jgi:hypothetical protein
MLALSGRHKVKSLHELLAAADNNGKADNG